MKISIIVPTLNEAKTIYYTLERLYLDHKPDEVVVVDGGSEDRTVQIASEFTEVISAEKGRALQMNAGALKAQGDIFLFLHADTLLPPRALELISNAIKKGAQGGRFRMRFNQRHVLLRLFETYTRFHLFSYGDQGFFVTREIFSKLKGFCTNVPFEDLDFYKRLRQVTQPVILKESVITSARRFSKAGMIKQKLINMLLVGLYYLGVDIAPLKRKFYPEAR